jgi:hypothetical protein
MCLLARARELNVLEPPLKTENYTLNALFQKGPKTIHELPLINRHELTGRTNEGTAGIGT